MITKEEVEKYFNAEADFVLDILPYEEIKIRRYHVRKYDIVDLLEIILSNPKLDFKEYTDKEDPRYSYIEVWKVADLEN